MIKLSGIHWHLPPPQVYLKKYSTKSKDSSVIVPVVGGRQLFLRDGKTSSIPPSLFLARRLVGYVPGPRWILDPIIVSEEEEGAERERKRAPH